MRGSILLERSMPLTWTRQESTAASVNPALNHIIFSLLDNLDEPLMSTPDSETASELLRIEAKLNVITQLLGLLLQERQSPQEAITVRFSNDSLAWHVISAPPVGTLLQVSLYPEVNLPIALGFEARVLAVEEGWMEVDMHGLSDDEQAIWSRWVFRQHRRQIAMARTRFAGHQASD
ncbi:MAG: PilZ domain-containing protein [Gammaproteobacteria bacterium]|jgi:hypothetical protein